jgi:hypothetical protein
MKKGIVAGVMSIASFAAGVVLGGKILVGMINDYKKRMERNYSNMILFNDWLEFVYSGGSIEQYFHDNGYKKIMIYGNGYIGKRLQQALAGSEIEVAAVMDKSVVADGNGILIGTDSEIPNVDCMVITPVYYHDEIYAMLREKSNVPIVSIQTVIEKDVKIN